MQQRDDVLPKKIAYTETNQKYMHPSTLRDLIAECPIFVNTATSSRAAIFYLNHTI